MIIIIIKGRHKTRNAHFDVYHACIKLRYEISIRAIIKVKIRVNVTITKARSNMVTRKNGTAVKAPTAWAVM